MQGENEPLRHKFERFRECLLGERRFTVSPDDWNLLHDLIKLVNEYENPPQVAEAIERGTEILRTYGLSEYLDINRRPESGRDPEPDLPYKLLGKVGYGYDYEPFSNETHSEAYSADGRVIQPVTVILCVHPPKK